MLLVGHNCFEHSTPHLQVRKQMLNYLITFLLYFTTEALPFSQVKHIILQLRNKIGARQWIFPALFNCWQTKAMSAI